MLGLWITIILQIERHPVVARAVCIPVNNRVRVCIGVRSVRWRTAERRLRAAIRATIVALLADGGLELGVEVVVRHGVLCRSGVSVIVHVVVFAMGTVLLVVGAVEDVVWWWHDAKASVVGIDGVYSDACERTRVQLFIQDGEGGMESIGGGTGGTGKGTSRLPATRSLMDLVLVRAS